MAGVASCGHDGHSDQPLPRDGGPLLQEAEDHQQGQACLDRGHAKADERTGKARGLDVAEVGGEADAGEAQQEAPVHEVAGHFGFFLAHEAEGVQQDHGQEAQHEDRELVEDDAHLAGVGQLGMHLGVLGGHHDGQHQHHQGQTDDRSPRPAPGPN